jgi:hypothetical protein
VPAHVPFALPEPPAAYRPPSLPPGTLNLSNGAPDVRLVPAQSIGRAYRRVLGLRGAWLLPDNEPRKSFLWSRRRINSTASQTMDMAW